MTEFLAHYASPLGAVTLAADGEHLTGLWFDGQAHFAETVEEGAEEAELPVFDRTREWLDAYFSGRDPGFTPPLAWKGTPFRQAVWELLLTVPFGQTVTYGLLAQRLRTEKGFPNASPRAVGGAVGHNPISLLVPCHRVLGTGGRLTGYAGGLDRKRYLLTMEGIPLSPETV